VAGERRGGERRAKKGPLKDSRSEDLTRFRKSIKVKKSGAFPVPRVKRRL